MMWLAVAAWAALIFFFSTRQSIAPSLGFWDYGFRKSAHMIEFGILGLLLWRTLVQHELPERSAIAGSALLALVYAFSDELHQSFVPGRHASFKDIGFDLAGITIALAMAQMAARRLRVAEA